MLSDIFPIKYEKNPVFWSNIDFVWFLMVLRVENDRTLIGEDFFPPGMTLQLLKNDQK